ncbi:MAG: hypothetical protein JXR37_09185 [Kiritimatiellae bacterium]|nr:hypothetical protein [Kiritimatiellia bacterium]
MSREMTIDYWHVEMPPHAKQTLEQLLRNIGNLPDDDSRNVDFQGVPFRLHEFHEWREYLEGEVIKIRMEDIPVKASIHGGIEAIDLKEDEGVGEETAFLYTPEMQVVTLQRNHFGTSAFKFARYCQELAGLDEPIFLVPILRPDVMKRLNAMSVLKKVEIRIAGIENAKQLDAEDVGFGEMLDIMATTRAPNLKLELSMGNRSGGLARQPVLQAIQRLWRFCQGTHKTVRTMRVHGVREIEEDGLSMLDKEIVDFIQDRLTDKVEVSLEDDRRVSYDQRRDRLREAWSRRRQEISALLRRP